MTVFRNAVTAPVIAFAVVAGGFGGFGIGPAHGVVVYPIDGPQAASIVHVRHLTNPSVSQIQAAIAPRTRINVSGTVNASNGQRLTINVDDVKLDFAQANTVQWSGGDTWAGFVEIGGKRVELLKLDMKVVGNGRCRGMVIHSPASDVRIAKCRFQNVADGFIADGVWQRIAIDRSEFLDCGDWTSSSTMEGGYGLFLEEDDEWPDHLWLSDVTVTLAPSSGQHAIRLSKVQNLRIEDSFFGANSKRSMWAYGINTATIRRSTFDKGSVMFNLKPFENQTDRPVQHVRMYDCEINHRSIMEPLQVYCGKGTRDVRFYDLDITSTTSNRAMMVGWRSGALTRNIVWYNGCNTFNGQPLWNYQSCMINDWSNQELEDLRICSIADPRD